MSHQIKNSTAEFLMFTASTGHENIHVRYEDENVWVSQKMMAKLFDVTVPNINIHLKQLIESGEIDPASTIKDYLIVQMEGTREVSRSVEHYNLQTVMAVGFRTNSAKAIQFRQRAQSVLKEFAIKGFVLDKQRLKNGTYLSEQFFDELLANIREIRASERKFYQKIADIYTTALDYNSQDPMTREFFATVQNKLHFAIHGHTAAGLIVQRANHTQPYMGLTTRAKAPTGKIVKSDVSIAKNYLTLDEIKSLDRYVTMYLDFAEDQASQKIPMTMKDRSDKLGVFVHMTGRKMLDNPGEVTAAIAKSFAESEFQHYRITQDAVFQSDFDKFLEEMN